MNFIQLFALSLFDGFSYVILCKKLIGSKASNIISINAISKVVLFAVLVALVSRYLPRNYSVVLNQVFMFILIYLTSKLAARKAMYLYVLSTVVIIFIQISVVMIVKLLFRNIQYTFFYGLIAQTIGIAMIIIISKAVPINLLYKFIIKNNRVFKYILLNLFILMASFLFYWHVDINNVLKSISSITILSVGIVYINFILLRNGLKNTYEEEQLKIYEKYLPIIDELINELRARQHEFDNHIQALNMLAVTNNSYEEIVESMKCYTKGLERNIELGNLIKLSNKVLAGLLYSKKKLSKVMGVHFEIVIENYHLNSKLRDYELVEVVGNLINNTFETEVEDNAVVLRLSKEKDMNVIEVRNKHPYLNNEIINQIFEKGFSTKSNSNRGYGLYNVQKIIKAYNGEIEVSNQIFGMDNYVVFRVLIY